MTASPLSQAALNRPPVHARREAQHRDVSFGDLSMALVPLLALLRDGFRRRGPKGWGLASIGQLRKSSGTLQLVVGRGIPGPWLATATGLAPPRLQLSGRPDPAHAPRLIHWPLSRLPACPPALSTGHHHGLRVHGVGWALILATLTT